MRFKIGDIIESDGLLGVVTELPNENISEDHIAVWFGEDNPQRASQGGINGKTPKVYTIPEDCCELANPPIYEH